VSLNLLFGCSDARQPDFTSAAVKEYTGGEQQRVLMRSKVDLFTTRCLSRQGFDYQPTRVESSVSVDRGDAFGLFYSMDSADRRAYGYGITATILNGMVLQSLMSAQMNSSDASYRSALVKCQKTAQISARKELGYLESDGKASQAFGYLFDRARERFLSQPEVAKKLRLWSECMSGRGEPARSPDEYQAAVFDELNSMLSSVAISNDGSADERLDFLRNNSTVVTAQQREVALARVQSSCDESSGWGSLESTYIEIQSEEFSWPITADVFDSDPHNSTHADPS
jgi:hypothetical protein